MDRTKTLSAKQFFALTDQERKNKRENFLTLARAHRPGSLTSFFSALDVPLFYLALGALLGLTLLKGSYGILATSAFVAISVIFSGIVRFSSTLMDAWEITIGDFYIYFEENLLDALNTDKNK